MNDVLSRLAWALPLVLVLALVAIFVVKRSLARMGIGTGANEPMRLRQSLPLSDALKAHLLDVDGQAVLVLEGTAASGSQIQVLTRTASPRPWSASGRRSGS